MIGVVMGTRPHKLEMLGVLLALIGCVFMIIDPKAARIGNQPTSVVPALLDIGSALFGALFFLMSVRNIKEIPICLLLLLMSSHTFVMNSLIAKMSDPTVQIMSFSTTHGCFGFLNPNQPLL